MADILKIVLVFVVILIFLRLKWNIGYVLLIASGLLFMLYLTPVPLVLATIKTMVTDAITIKLFFALTLIRVLEIVLRERQALTKMTEASRKILRKKKLVIISMPMLIGLLPSLGGAYFSAPMVDEATKDLEMSQEEKGFINYWFRHPWEYILPLYPGLILASALSGIDLRTFIFANTPYSLLLIAGGFLLAMKGVKGNFRPPYIAGSEPVQAQSWSAGFFSSSAWSFLPISLILFMVIGLNMELPYAMAITILFLMIFYKFRVAEIVKVLRHGFALEVFILISGAMLFKFALESSGAVGHLNQYFTQSNIPVIAVLFVLPFVSGLLTGLTFGFVGSTFPLILSFTGGAHLHQLSFAFAAGYFGVLLSPVHLCFVLTREYFKADAWGIYKKILPACGIIMAGMAAEYLLLK